MKGRKRDTKVRPVFLETICKEYPAPLPALPGEESIAELEQRLEMFPLSLSPSQPLEPCVWACGCFLTHGAE